MRKYRVPAWSGWIPTLLLCVALSVALVPSRGEQDADPDVIASCEAGATDSRVPLLVGRAPAGGADASGAEPATLAESDAASDPAAEALAAEEEDGAHMRGGEALTARHPLVAPVIAVQERYTRELLRHPLVVGTATGMNDRGEIALVVLAKAAITDLPSRLGGAPVMVYVTGELFASKGKPDNPGGGKGKKEQTPDPTARFDRAVPIGVSTGHPDITAGTIGCRVTDGSLVFALSNNHVYADENLADLGEPAIQPGTFDGGTSPADDIGALDDYEEIDFTAAPAGANTMDAAIALSSTALLGNATPSDGYGLPKSETVAPAINLRVRKYGRTTAQTNGKIFAINATVNVGYSTAVAGFVGQIMISPGSFSAGGDSGALIVVQKGSDARKAVGLLFAGSSSSTIASPIGPILTRFDVTIDGE